MQKLEQIENFGALLDFLSNPDEYKGLVKDVRQAAKDYKELVEKKRQIRDIDAWRAFESVKLSQQYEELDRKNEAHLKNVDDLAEKVSAHKKSIVGANNKLQERTTEIDSREQAVAPIEKDKAKLDKLISEYETKLANVKQEKALLKDQAAKIKAAAGALA